MYFKKDNKIKWFMRGIKQCGICSSTDWRVRKSIINKSYYFLVPQVAINWQDNRPSVILERRFLSDDMIKILDFAAV